jgi:ribosomal protein S2
VIPGNDDAIRSCSLVVRAVADGIAAGKAHATPADFEPAPEAEQPTAEAPEPEQPAEPEAEAAPEPEAEPVPVPEAAQQTEEEGR